MKPSPFYFSFLLILFAGCESKPKTPEEVIRAYVSYMDNGDCEGASSLCIENALQVVESSIDSGCQPIDQEVKSCDCETREDITRCACLVIIDGMEMKIPYALKLLDGEWKLFDLSKDCGPQVWEEQDSN